MNMQGASDGFFERPRVLIAEQIAEGGIAHLRAVANVDLCLELTAAELLTIIPHYDGLIVRGATRVTANVLAVARRLRVVGRAGSGIDNIDVGAARERGVMVVNTPDANGPAVAELAFGLLLALARHLPQAVNSLASGEWTRGAFLGSELRGKTLGLIGLGRIGTAVVQRARAFEMSMLGYDPWVTPTHAHVLGIALVPLDDLLKHSDVVSLHVPLTSETRGLLSATRLRMLKTGAYLVNTARGGLIDELELRALLDSGHCGGAALDVFEREPPDGSPLIGHPRVLATPHLGASTTEAQERAGIEIATRIAEILAGENTLPRAATAQMLSTTDGVSNAGATYES